MMESTTIGNSQEAYLAAVLRGDRHGAFDVLDRAHAGGASLTSIYLDVLQPSLREIGRLWQQNEVTVAEEHLATAITQTAMARLFGQAFRATRTPERSLVAACADRERHDIGLRMLCDLLEMEGWEATYLGAAVPVSDFAAMVGRRKPDVVALSVSLAPHLPRLEEMIAAVRALDVRPAPAILVGGRAFNDDPGLAQRVGADMTAQDARAAVAMLRAWKPAP